MSQHMTRDINMYIKNLEVLTEEVRRELNEKRKKVKKQLRPLRESSQNSQMDIWYDSENNSLENQDGINTETSKEKSPTRFSGMKEDLKNVLDEINLLKKERERLDQLFKKSSK